MRVRFNFSYSFLRETDADILQHSNHSCRQYFSAVKKRITWNSAQTWATKIVKNHGFVRRQPSAYRAKPGSECYVIDRFIGRLRSGLNIAPYLMQSGLRVVRNSTENLRYVIIDEVATWVSEHSVYEQCCRYTVYRRNFADIILWQHRKIHRSISSLKRKCSFMLKSEIKSCPRATFKL